MHKVINPKVLYFGTPVLLVSTLNGDGTPNLAPISSGWWLGSSCMLGMSTASQTVENLIRDRECVLNLPSPELVDAVDRLALTTGRNPVPEYKAQMGYRHEPAKFQTAGLTPHPSDLVRPFRVAECPVQLEGRVEEVSTFGQGDPRLSVPIAAIEIRVLRVHVEEEILVGGERNYIDPEKWQPLIMNFCEFFGLSGKVHPSRLAGIYGPPRS